jgi:hypothetical protein
MSRQREVLLAACSGIALLAGAVFSVPEPVHAQLGFFIRVPGLGIYGGRGGCRHCGGGHSHSDDDARSDDGGSRKDRTDRDMATPPTRSVENKVFGDLAYLNGSEVNNTVGELGTTKDVTALGKAVSRAKQSDWTASVADLVDRFQKESKKDSRITTPGDVTEHAIEQTLDSALKNAKLDTFESFVGENWTSEHLRVMVLDRIKPELSTMFNGNSRGYAPMQEVDRLIQQAAQATYRRIFEVSEFMAANRGSGLFMQRLYQAQGNLVDARLREVADNMITRAANEAVAKYETPLRQDENGYALRYRAQRIIFDCLSENVERISSSETGMVTSGELEQKIDDTAKRECAAWLDNQFGSDSSSVKAQKPMPLRVVWSTTGPKDDPSMYGRAVSGMQ